MDRFMVRYKKQINISYENNKKKLNKIYILNENRY